MQFQPNVKFEIPDDRSKLDKILKHIFRDKKYAFTNNEGKLEFVDEQGSRFNYTNDHKKVSFDEAPIKE